MLGMERKRVMKEKRMTFWHLPSCQKMSANKETNLVQAYSELNKFCLGGDYDRALKATGKSK